MQITLATLKDATAQQVFDQVKTHLLTQNQKAKPLSYGACQYRYEGLKCAAGCLISDDEYSPDMEVGALGGGSWPRLVHTYIVPEWHKDLITALQCIHDDYMMDEWASRLHLLACDFGLTCEVNL